MSNVTLCQFLLFFERCYYRGKFIVASVCCSLDDGGDDSRNFSRSFCGCVYLLLIDDGNDGDCGYTMTIAVCVAHWTMVMVKVLNVRTALVTCSVMFTLSLLLDSLCFAPNGLKYLLYSVN